MRFLFWATLSVLVAAGRRRVRRAPYAPRHAAVYVPRHSYELSLDRLWTQRLAQIAARRRAAGWA